MRSSALIGLLALGLSACIRVDLPPPDATDDPGADIDGGADVDPRDSGPPEGGGADVDPRDSGPPEGGDAEGLDQDGGVDAGDAGPSGCPERAIVLTATGAYYGQPSGASVIDLDCDGDDELIFARQSSAAGRRGVVIFSAAHPERSSFFPTSVEPGAVALAQVTGDARFDLIVLGQNLPANTDGSIEVYEGQAGGFSAIAKIIPLSYEPNLLAPSHLLVVDVDGRGAPDLIAGDHAHLELWTVSSADWFPSIRTVTTRVLYAPGSTNIQNIYAASSTIAGARDLIVVSSGFVAWHAGVLGAPVSAPWGEVMWGSTAVDLDRDGRVEVIANGTGQGGSLIAAGRSADGVLTIYPYRGAGPLALDDKVDGVAAGALTQATDRPEVLALNVQINFQSMAVEGATLYALLDAELSTTTAALDTSFTVPQIGLSLGTKAVAVLNTSAGPRIFTVNSTHAASCYRLSGAALARCR